MAKSVAKIKSKLINIYDNIPFGPFQDSNNHLVYICYCKATYFEKAMEKHRKINLGAYLLRVGYEC